MYRHLKGKRRDKKIEFSDVETARRLSFARAKQSVSLDCARQHLRPEPGPPLSDFAVPQTRQFLRYLQRLETLLQGPGRVELPDAVVDLVAGFSSENAPSSRPALPVVIATMLTGLPGV